jgi:hypothetical protein
LIEKRKRREVMKQYIARHYTIPSIEDVLLKKGIKKKDFGSLEAAIITRKRKLRMLYLALPYALAATRAAINYYPENVETDRSDIFHPRELVEELISKLEIIFEEAWKDDVKEGQEVAKIEEILEALSPVANILTNWPLWLPKELHCAILSGRDICDYAIRQPCL